MPADIIFCRNARKRRPREVFGEKDSASREGDLLATLVLDMLMLLSQNNSICGIPLSSNFRWDAGDTTKGTHQTEFVILHRGVASAITRSLIYPCRALSLTTSTFRCRRA